MGKLIDLKPLDELSDELAKQGKQMFENILEGFKAAGINTKDPLEMVLVLQNFNRSKFENMFHPSTYNKEGAELDTLCPTAMGAQMLEMRDEIIDKIENSYKGALDGKRSTACFWRYAYLWPAVGGMCFKEVGAVL